MVKSLFYAASIWALATAAAAAEPLKIVASFSIIGDMAKNVGKEHIELTTLVGAGGDAHVYEPKTTDAAAVKAAQVLLVNGLRFEGFLPRLIEASGATAPVVELTKGITPLKNEEQNHEDDAGHNHAEETGAHDHDHGYLDPHAFQSAANAKIYVQNIAEAFCAADAANCTDYKTNAQAYSASLEALDAEIKADLASIAPERRKVITSHDAFGYFGKAYGIEFLAPEGISTEAEASAADVAKLIRQIRADKASAIFIENIRDARLIERISAETGLKIGGTLYSDALSDGGPAQTYIDLMRANAQTIKGALAGA